MEDSEDLTSVPAQELLVFVETKTSVRTFSKSFLFSVEFFPRTLYIQTKFLLVHTAKSEFITFHFCGTLLKNIVRSGDDVKWYWRTF